MDWDYNLSTIWSLQTLREKLIKVGAKVVMHYGYVFIHMVEVTLIFTIRGQNEMAIYSCICIDIFVCNSHFDLGRNGTGVGI